MQLNGNTAGEYLSRKYTMTMSALIIVLCLFGYSVYMTQGKPDVAAWGILVVGILGQYGYFNTKETGAVKELKMAGLSAPNSDDPKAPIEPEAAN